MTTAAILGGGSVGGALGARLLHIGATVRFGLRAPEAPRRPPARGAEGIPALPPAEAAAGAEMIFLAVPASAALDATRSAGDLTGKILVDCTNPLRWEDGPVWAPPPEGSVTQALAAAFPGLPVVKGFNHFGAEIQADPRFPSGPADALFASDDAAAKARVMGLAASMGFRPRDAGPLRNAGVLENLAVLWIHLAVAGGVGRNFNFRVEVRG